MAGSASAQHEAGHAVAARLLGRHVVHVSLYGGPLGGGPFCVDEPPDDAVGVNALIDDATVFAAGCAAAGQSPSPHGASDFHYLGKLAQSATLSAQEAQAFEAWIIARAEALVAHPHFAALAGHIAEALDRDGMLDEDAFEVEVLRGELRYLNAPVDPRPPSRVAEPKEPIMARTASPPALVQCREGVCAEIGAQEIYAQKHDIFPADAPIVSAFPQAFVELGALPHSAPFIANPVE